MRYLLLFIMSIFCLQYIKAQDNNNDSFSFSMLRGLCVADTVCINSETSVKGFIFDTGAELSYLDTEFAKKIKFKNTNKKVNVIDNQDHMITYPIVFIDSLKLGNTIYYKVKAVIVDLSTLENIDGIIGCNLLKDYIWKFDYPSLKITRYTNLPKTPNYYVAFKYKHGIPHINLQIGKKKIRNVIFDLGSVNSISLKFKDTTLLLSETIDSYYSKLYSYSMNNPQRKLIKVKISKLTSISIGSKIMDSINVGFTSSRTIGNGLFKHSILIMDFPSKKIYFDTLVKKKTTIFGCRFKVNESGEIIVSVVIEGSPADKIGIKPDDILVYWKGYNLNVLIDEIHDETIYTSDKKTATLKMKDWKQEKVINKILKI